MNKKEKYNYLLEEIIASAKLEQEKTFTYKFYEEANEILSQTQLEKMCGTLAKKFPAIFKMISNASPSMYIWEIHDVKCRIERDIGQLEKIKREIGGLLEGQDENVKRDKKEQMDENNDGADNKTMILKTFGDIEINENNLNAKINNESLTYKELSSDEKRGIRTLSLLIHRDGKVEYKINKFEDITRNDKEKNKRFFSRNRNIKNHRKYGSESITRSRNILKKYKSKCEIPIGEPIELKLTSE